MDAILVFEHCVELSGQLTGWHELAYLDNLNEENYNAGWEVYKKRVLTLNTTDSICEIYFAIFKDKILIINRHQGANGQIVSKETPYISFEKMASFLGMLEIPEAQKNASKKNKYYILQNENSAMKAPYILGISNDKEALMITGEKYDNDRHNDVSEIKRLDKDDQNSLVQKIVEIVGRVELLEVISEEGKIIKSSVARRWDRSDYKFENKLRNFGFENLPINVWPKYEVIVIPEQ